MSKYWFSGDNFLDDATLTASSTESGTIGKADKEGIGSATAYLYGAYAGPKTRVYTVEIDSISAGAEVGQATYRWKHTDSSGWEATGVTTSTTAALLDSGIYLKFTSGTGADFAVGDVWTATAVTPYGRYNLIGMNRDEVWQSDSLDGPTWIKADLGSARAVDSVVILDHNITSGATVTLEANSSDSWGTPAYSQVLTWNSGTIAYLMDSAETYQWWRLTVSDGSNPDGYIEISEMFLGDQFDPQAVVDVTNTERGLDMSLMDSMPRQAFYLTFTTVTEAIRSGLMDKLEGLFSSSERRIKPFWFCFDTDDPSDNTWLMELVDPTIRYRMVGRDAYDIPVNMIESRRTND